MSAAWAYGVVLTLLASQEIVDFNIGTVVVYESSASTKWAAHVTKEIEAVDHRMLI